MPQQQNNIKHYGVEDLERYHSGKMSKQEMHALEKAALDDPFLSDAVDGYVHSQTAGSDISELKNKLHEKAGVKKLVQLKPKPISVLLKVAAVLVLFAGLGWLLYNNNLKKAEIAKVEENSNKNETTETAADKIADTTVIKQSEGTITLLPADEIKQQNNIGVPNNWSDSSNQYPVASGSTYYSLDQTATATASVNDSTSNAKPGNIYPNIIPESANNNFDNALTGKTAGIVVSPTKKIRGRITDSKGNPVSFANVIDKKNNIGVQSNREGSFALSTPDSAPKVDVNAVGYKTITKALSDDSTANNLVLLEQDVALKEVVVNSAFGNKKAQRAKSYPITFKDEKIQRITVTNAIPIQGWQDFYKYVSDSLKTLEQLGPAAVGTEVLVSFDINNDGKPIGINVRKSLCVTCDAEVFRIIQGSPAWKLNKKRKKARAVVKF